MYSYEKKSDSFGRTHYRIFDSNDVRLFVCWSETTARLVTDALNGRDAVLAPVIAALLPGLDNDASAVAAKRSIRNALDIAEKGA